MQGGSAQACNCDSSCEGETGAPGGCESADSGSGPQLGHGGADELGSKGTPWGLAGRELPCGLPGGQGMGRNLGQRQQALLCQQARNPGRASHHQVFSTFAPAARERGPSSTANLHAPCTSLASCHVAKEKWLLGPFSLSQRKALKGAFGAESH